VRYFKTLWNAITTVQDVQSLIATEFFRTWILPVLLTAGALVVGLFDNIYHGVPWIVIYSAAVFVLAMSAIAVLRLDEFRVRRKVEGKFFFRSPHVGFNKTEDGRKIKTVQIGFQLENSATFPLSYKVTNIRTNADLTLPSSGNILNKGEIIQGGDTTLFRDCPMELKEPTSETSAELEFDLIYGLAGNERYPISKKINISLRYDPEKGVLHYPWLNAPESIT
jgi:hypothetical protein